MLYSEMRKEVIESELKKLGRPIEPDLTHLATDFQPVMGEILDKLGITLECCRVRFLTSVEFDDLAA